MALVFDGEGDRMKKKSRNRITWRYPGHRIAVSAATLSMLMLAISACMAPAGVQKYESDAAPAVNELEDDPIYLACTYIETDLAKAKFPTHAEAVVYADALCRLEAAFCLKDPSACKPTVARYVKAQGDVGPAMLYQAAFVGRTELVRQLLELEVEPNNPISENGWCPLMIAAAEGHGTTVDALLEGGAQCDARNAFGRTALMFASSYGYDDIVRDLLAHGADPNIVPTDGEGWTALMGAAHNNRIQTVRLLLDGGADPALTDLNGMTALGIARASGSRGAAQLLETVGD